VEPHERRLASRSSPADAADPAPDPGAGRRAWVSRAAASAYERGRPGYPAAAIDWLLPDGARRVCDLAAGTGKLTRELVRSGRWVVAVEPAAGMRAELSRTVPRAAVAGGVAEAIPLATGTVDAVLVAQAWHWVDPVRAVPEVARVLTPGGTLGLLWNDRDEREGWAAELGAIFAELAPAGEEAPPVVGPPFEPYERRDVEWSYRIRTDRLVDRVASASYVLTAPDGRRVAVLDRVRRLVERHPALAGRAEVDFPYVTRCYRARLAGAGPRVAQSSPPAR
jgi:SAM-dependent methyltransferase